MLIDVEKRNVLILASTQALFQTASVMVITLSGIVGWMLATDKSLATLPIAMMMVAAAVTMIPASLLMQRYGRKAGFLLGATLCSATSCSAQQPTKSKIAAPRVARGRESTPC